MLQSDIEKVPIEESSFVIFKNPLILLTFSKWNTAYVKVELPFGIILTPHQQPIMLPTQFVTQRVTIWKGKL